MAYHVLMLCACSKDSQNVQNPHQFMTFRGLDLETGLSESFASAQKEHLDKQLSSAEVSKTA